VAILRRPLVVSNLTIAGGTHNGTLFNLIPSSQRQRAALLEVNGTIYAGFGSACSDFPGGTSRGWLSGWNATSLASLAHNELTDQKARPRMLTIFSPRSGCQVMVWRLIPLNNIYFSTGDSDLSVDTYSTTFNLEESAIKLSPDLSTVSDFFNAR
jgi:hypothetical protein